ncbi:hypothetical protein GCM10009665_72240 [Kitasatospora nipponensis]|uniref:Thioesterase domain-containing protein n=1 Tax=Kitasatospora nipponensis TaxID=258049 RepID=A0ABN1X2S8_9ACTN
MQPMQPLSPTAARTPAPLADPWVRCHQPRPAARLRLICFHPSGAGSIFYREWAQKLPADVEVLAVQLPGRETRIMEPCLTEYRETVERLHSAVRPYLDRPYALFGHSLGALLAYGVALAAQRDGDPAPARLLVSGSGGPGSVHPKRGRGGWSEEDLIEDLRTMGGTPEEVLRNRDLLDLILPVLRADFTICDTFDDQGRPQLDCPISVFGGLDDFTGAEDLARWESATRAGATVRTYPGGHFFLSEPSPAAPEVLAAVSADLTAVAG